uniref:NADH dehydrogenase subunit 9 n=1 Tax=Panagrolaimus sp. ES5 TaxID=591445 RepID=A0AC34G0C7_9BILA
MLMKTFLDVQVNISTKSETKVLFKNDIYFIVVPEILADNTYLFHLKGFSTDLEVVRIEQYNGYNYNTHTDIYYRLNYDKESKTFTWTPTHPSLCKFFISSKVEFKEVNYVSVDYRLQFPGSRTKLLDLFDCYIFPFEHPGYEYLKFKCCIRKFKKGSVTLTVENPYNLRINGI